MSTHPLAAYLADCRARHRTGAVTPETSFYGPLETLLNAVGQKLKKPRVRCFMSLKNVDGNMPDGGLFTPDQIPRGEGDPLPGQKPARGAIEAKPLADDLAKLIRGEQVARYLAQHQQVLVTNFREFALLGHDDHEKPVRLEFYRLAGSEKEFWELAAHPEQAAKDHGERLLQFIERCLRRPVPLTDPKDVAWFLASYARDARSRVEHSQAHEQVDGVRKALEQSLGLKVEDDDGEHFFQSTLVQTLFYGLFSAWVLWHRSGPGPRDRFDWEKASKYLHVPILRKLFRELTDPSHLDEWDNLTEVMGWAADTLNRVDRGIFFERFREAEAVQYFYEPFLEAFDPELRKQLGVWYTPPEIVKYMVARVDQVLKTEFQIADGLADDQVVVLDPCCGTGAFLVETLSVIAGTLADQGEGATLAGSLKKAATERVFGFEILPAPFVVAHLQLGLFLQGLGAAFNEKQQERAAVYLTNALTGWQPPTGPKQKLAFPEMEDERTAADRIKQTQPVLVVIGNPPYNGFAGLPVEEEAGLVEPYRTTKDAPKPQGQGLNDLYVRFFRVAERCITERGVKHGIVCYISNYSWLDGLSHTGMRERFLEEFDDIWIDSLNGDKYKTGKTTPDGKPDPSVFSTPQNREGIQVGTAVALLARKPDHDAPATVHFHDVWGDRKREELVESLAKPRKAIKVEPVAALGLPFRPMATNANYTTWPLLEDVFPASFPGVQTKQDGLVVDVDLDRLQQRMADFFNPDITDAEMAARHPGSMDGTHACEPIATRGYLRNRGILPRYLVKFLYRPFDSRWIYWEPETKLLGRPSPDYFPQVFDGNLSLGATRQNRKGFDAPIATPILACLHIIERSANMFPMLLVPAAEKQKRIVDTDDAREGNAARQLGERVANISDAGMKYLNGMNGVADHPNLFNHTIAILHAPAYASENAAALRQDWPRVPLPAVRDALLASADLGRRVTALLDPEAKVDGVTTGKLSTFLKLVGQPTKIGGGNFSEANGDYSVTARWGIAGKGGITMPGKGKVQSRPFDGKEREALESVAGGREVLGDETCDIFLNDNAYWKNVPRPVWEYTLGGYQVLKKWLSYREEALLGRPLTVDEVIYIRDVIRRITALLLLGPDLDTNYGTAKADAYPWPAP
jgi:hypothetical protein